MLKFIENIGEFFAANYFDEDFGKKVLDKSGHGAEERKVFQKRISALKDPYFKFKRSFLEDRLRTKDKVTETHRFHSKVLNALGYEGDRPQYDTLFHLDEKNVLPIRHILYRGDQVHMMVMEMQSLINEGDTDPDGLFEQQYNVEDETLQSPPQKYHRVQWQNVFTVPEGLKISPMVINKAVSELFLIDARQRPRYILLCAGNQYFLLEQEKWFRGSYLRFDLEELFNEAALDRENYALFYFLLAKEALSPQADIVLMDQLDEDSHKSAYEVTKDLKEGVVHAVERLANETVHYWKQQGKDLKDIDADKLKDDCLSMVYRLLFLFYAESRPDLELLPTNDPVYEQGYSLEMLRDLEQVPLNTASSINGHFFHESITRLFHLMSSGYREKQEQTRSFRVRRLDSPLFDAAKLNYLKDVKLRNEVWQDVICQLSLSRLQRGKARGRISYANLGINQLGSVYESLLAFRGFFAEVDHIEVHRKREGRETSAQVESKDGSYLVPRTRIDDFDPLEVYTEGPEETVRIIKQGTFIYRLSGRDRQKSASYYTPEVLTECTVKYTLKPILERLDKGEMKALDLLDLKILEPAMGAAAFHNEAIDQLAEAYLLYRQQELKQKVAPDKFREELQKIKAYIATNNVYGVDLNPTAVELGKLSLWLNVIHKDMQTPFFGYRLGCGNAVVGAWLRVYKEKHVVQEVEGGKKSKTKKEWWTKAPRSLAYTAQTRKLDRKQKEIYHFLLPDAGMVPSADIKLLKEEYPEAHKAVKEWRKEFMQPISKNELQKLYAICDKVDELLEEHYRFQAKVNRETAGNWQFFGLDAPELALHSYSEKENLAANRNATNAPYYKLKLVMDYWCALWFWDMRDAAELPTRSDWYNDLVSILDFDVEAAIAKRMVKEQTAGRDEFAPDVEQVKLFEGEEGQLSLSNYRKEGDAFSDVVVHYLAAEKRTGLWQNRRVELVQRYAHAYRFFHYQLEFIEVFKERDGFDVIVGNPPWVKVTSDEVGIIGEVYPELLIRELAAKEKLDLQDLFNDEQTRKNHFTDELVSVIGVQQYLSAIQVYPYSSRSFPNLYKAIIENCISISAGRVGIIHDKGIYDDKGNGHLREFLYQRLVYYFQFQNELLLFSEVGNAKKYEISIYSGKPREVLLFDSISNLFHPITIDLCYSDTSNRTIGIKDESGWELKGSRKRIVKYDEERLEIIRKYFDPKSKAHRNMMINLHLDDQFDILAKFSAVKKTLKTIENEIKGTTMLGETESVRKRIIRRYPEYVPHDKFIEAAPHFYVANPYYQNPNEGCSSHRDYSRIQLNVEGDAERIERRTVYELVIDKSELGTSPRYVYCNRKRAQPSNERTLISTILPPNSVHTIGVYSIDFQDQLAMVNFAACTHTLVFDYIVRITNKVDFLWDTMANMPLLDLDSHLIHRALLLNCSDSRYSQLWNEHSSVFPGTDTVAGFELKNRNSQWSVEKIFRNQLSRAKCLMELDVIVAMRMGMTLEELIVIYTTQFPVLAQNERDTFYDSNGAIVFTCSKGLAGVGLDRADWEKIKDMKAEETYEHTITKSELYQGKKITYHAPFDKCDRVEDYKVVWAHFEKVFADSEKIKG